MLWLWHSWEFGKILYDVQPRYTREGKGSYAVLRKGIKGGTRVVAVYDDYEIALRVKHVLNSERGNEK